MRNLSNTLQTVVALILTASLAACGGGSGPSAPSLDLAADQGFDTRSIALTAFRDAVGNIGGTTVADFPTTGSAAYAGGIDIGVPVSADQTEEIIGLVDITVDYQARSMSGTIGDFTSQSEGAIAGSMDIENGRVSENASAAVFTGGATGTITVTEVESPITIEFTNGTFQGPNGEYISAGVQGDASALFDEAGPDISGEIFAIRQDLDENVE